MRPSLHPRLINGPFDDPGLLVNLLFRKQALLFDLGDLSALSPGDLLKIDPLFVTHTHMDHFIGFDQILRLLLGRAKRLHLFGPKGFLANVAGKLSGYTWNLVQNYSEALVLEATEIDGDHRTTQRFDAQSGFSPSAKQTGRVSDGIIYEDAALCVRAACLDHQIPCLAFSLEERFHVNILKTELGAMGLPVGPWLNHFKRLLHRQADPATPVEVPAGAGQAAPRRYPLGQLAPRIARITRGQKIVYVADVRYGPENAAKIISLARGADHLFIEAAFLHSEQAIAQAKHHLTARQAGLLAHKAQVAQMTIFHHSPRYADQAHLLEREAREAFAGKIRV
jgi:ribonuclease Z